MDKFYKISKILALFIPLIISIIVLLITLINSTNYATYTQAIESKINLGISIIGIAITVWVGLNIYNLIEKKEVDELNVLVSSSIEKLKKIEPKITEFEDLIKENEKYNEFLLANQKWSDSNESLTNLIKDGQNTLTIYHSIDTYVEKFIILTNINNSLKKPHYISYDTFIRILCCVIDSIILNKDHYTKHLDIYTSEQISHRNLEEKINYLLNSIKLQLQDMNCEFLLKITDFNAAAHNYYGVCNYLKIIEKKASENRFHINNEDIHSICNKLDECINLFKQNLNK